jgi:hypothetical protein
VIAAEAIVVADLEETKRLAAEFEAMGGGALAMALAQEAEPGDPLRECWLARERLRVSEARSINLPEILTARTDVTAEAAEAPPRRPLSRRTPPPRKLPAPWKLLPPRGAPRKPLPMHLARERPWRPSCRKSLTAARAAWPMTPRRSPGGMRSAWGGERN